MSRVVGSNRLETCPRCNQSVPVNRDGRLFAHTDSAIGCPCPMRGLTVAQAKERIVALRGRMWPS